MSHQFASLLDQTCLTEDVDLASQEILWSMIDYGNLCADPNKKPLTLKAGLSNLSSQRAWTFDSNMLGNVPSQFEGDSTNIFTGLTPTMRLDEVEYLLNCSSGANGMA